ncbi:MAG TPA: SHOCT domain-containing protein [Gammaproteobacteria bacterium]|nr:SHOCT domain-containing protein [Gammaproteobacteria bacterium]
MSKVTNMKHKVCALGAAALLAVAVAGCAAQGGGTPPNQANSLNSAPQGSTVLWHSGVQFVALSSQGDGSAPNQQPADLAPAQVRRALAQLKVVRGSQGAPEPVFTDRTLKVLSPRLAAGLSKAGPHEDVTFAVVSAGNMNLLMIHIKQRVVTTGRVFYQNGRLNVIFGLMHQPFETKYAKYAETGRLPPMPPGDRARRVQSGWRIAGGQAVEHPASGRTDWVSVALARTPVAKAGSAAKTRKPAAGHKHAASGPASSVQREYDRLATRLRVLDKLHQQGLITDQEYRAKRKQILGGL